ncbi:TetR/AcrR family transcriptional regulator C-terminal domain-containing protein [Proteiniborus sp. MB09-C3]|uniref:TetR/AcrR family transcriptional regulator C-terminal domain-containing protein n=1 Tax=Proteiniborus sp. MB09-C3 TaxID=3050072 RepID=UPI002554384D|nr:TetR/AcrR family transcriptional regulator C-terminal domain-containing protein [Proteiniborus sp. MB09-C3]WIV11873.1 TetR/AcrR family transcriptional regulator C-terminal domain-containing protein [Proteiniborus sp. MB09-C3]
MSDSSITKQALATSMKELMMECPLSKINIGDIVERCNLSRKSFYYHFKDKYDLVNWIYYTEFASNFQNNSDIFGWSLLESICEFFYENKAFYRNALEVRGQNSFYDYFGELLSPVIEIHFRSIFGDSEHKEFYITFYTNAIRTSITNWLSEGAKILPKEYVELIKSAVMGVAIQVMREIEE